MSATPPRAMLELRASSLNHVRHCHGYSRLAARHNSDSPATRSGSLVHDYIAQVFDFGKGPAGSRWPEMVKKWSPVAEDPDDLRAIADEFLDWMKVEYRHLLVRGHRTEMPMRHVFAELTEVGSLQGVALCGTADLVTVDSRGLAHLWDWKLYADPSRLPPITEDLQMAAYAVLLAKGNQLVDRVVVRRALVRQRRVDELYFSRDDLDVATRTIQRIIGDLAAAPDEYTPSPRCSQCLLRRYCPSYLGQAGEAPKAMVPYKSGPITDEVQAAWLARAIPAAKDLLEKATDELRLWVRDHGPVRDGDYEWGPQDVTTRNLTGSATAFLGRLLGAETALRCAGAPSRARLKQVLGEAKYAEVMRELEEAGLLEGRTHDRWEWRKNHSRPEVDE